MSEETTGKGPGTAMARLAAEFAAMIRFYSRLSPPPLSRLDDPTAPPPFGTAIRMLPFSALVIALPGALVAWLLSMTQLSSPVVAALALVVTTIVTGAFHEDGIADVADGFGGGMIPERRLEIMKDSRIGAFGGVALAAQFALRTALLADLLDGFDGPATALVMLAVASAARVAPLALMALMPPARADGLGRAAGAPQSAALALAFGGAGALFIAVTVPLAGTAATLTALGVAALALWAHGRLAMAKIGGFTGDVVGAGTIVAEIALMVGLTAV